MIETHACSQILSGEANLVELDERSLYLRGKKSKVDKAATKTQKRSIPKEEAEVPSPGKKARVEIDLTSDNEFGENRTELEALIDTSDKTAFQKMCLKALLQIPPGQFSTYGLPESHSPIQASAYSVRNTGALSKFLQSSPRAVGNAMRGNPFAPRVPCHRILASDRSIGGTYYAPVKGVHKLTQS